MLGIQHEMQHQELMVYDFQHYFERFPDPSDNYEPLIISEPPKASEITTRLSSKMVDIPEESLSLDTMAAAFATIMSFQSTKYTCNPSKWTWRL